MPRLSEKNLRDRVRDHLEMLHIGKSLVEPVTFKVDLIVVKMTKNQNFKDIARISGPRGVT